MPDWKNVSLNRHIYPLMDHGKMSLWTDACTLMDHNKLLYSDGLFHRYLNPFNVSWNYYQQFNLHLSLVASPTALTKKMGQPQELDSRGRISLSRVETCFLLRYHPSLAWSHQTFYVEVDALSVGVEALLTQKGVKRKFFSSGFCSKAFSPAVKNYSNGDKNFLLLNEP